MEHTVIGLFEDFETARKVVHDFANRGYEPEQISIVSRDTGEEFSAEAEMDDYKDAKGRVDSERMEAAGVGSIVGGSLGLLAGLASLAIPGIGPAIAAGPIIAGVLGLTAGVAAGGLVGWLSKLGVKPEYAERYAEGVRRGGALVVVHTETVQAEKAWKLMRVHGALDIEDRDDDMGPEDWKTYVPHEHEAGDRQVA
jgi:uncharacterized membrane protein